MKADPLVDCPSCGKPALKRLMAGGAGMIFKGSGFYLTDYKKPGSSAPSPSTSSSAKPKDDSASTTTSKPETPKSDK
jgi:predicted nucleic acid-binding Zn ribbon protein